MDKEAATSPQEIPLNAPKNQAVWSNRTTGDPRDSKEQRVSENFSSTSQPFPNTKREDLMPFTFLPPEALHLQVFAEDEEDNRNDEDIRMDMTVELPVCLETNSCPIVQTTPPFS